MLKKMLLAMADSEGWKRWTTRSALTRRTVRRFVAGETLEEALDAAAILREEGLLVTMDYLGEAVSTAQEADGALASYRRMIEAMSSALLESTISVKPTQLGLGLNPQECASRIRVLVEEAKVRGVGVEIDMEDSPYTQATLDLYTETLQWAPGTRLALQSYLRRSEDDFRQLIAAGGSVRLVKGAYLEPQEVAFQKKSEVDEAFRNLVSVGLTREAREAGFYLAVGTHDDALVSHAVEVAKENGLSPEEFEFQFLFGIRKDLQRHLAAEGYRVRVYLPFGDQWYPYFMRRLAERPANLAFILKNMFKG